MENRRRPTWMYIMHGRWELVQPATLGNWAELRSGFACGWGEIVCEEGWTWWLLEAVLRWDLMVVALSWRGATRKWDLWHGIQINKSSQFIGLCYSVFNVCLISAISYSERAFCCNTQIWWLPLFSEDLENIVCYRRLSNQCSVSSMSLGLTPCSRVPA